jgi:hypothetical protein
MEGAMPRDEGWGDGPFSPDQGGQDGTETGARAVNPAVHALQNRDSRELGQQRKPVRSGRLAAQVVRALLRPVGKWVSVLTQRKGEKAMTAATASRNGHANVHSVDVEPKKASVIGRIGEAPRQTLGEMIAEEQQRDGPQQCLMMGDAINWSGGVIAGCINMHVHEMLTGLPSFLWEAGSELLEEDDGEGRANVLMLDALIASPEVMQRCLQRLRATLVHMDHSLGSASHNVLNPGPITPELAMPRYHQINGSTFFIDRDANLSIDEREGSRPLVQLTAQEAYGVLTFMRLPGVAQLIEHVDAVEQERIWHDYEADPETVAGVTRKQAYELLLEDKELLTLLVEHIEKDYVLTPRDAA